MQPADLAHVAPDDLPDMIDPRRAAVAVIDMQNDFAAPDAVVRVGGDPATVGAAIDRMEAVVAAGRKAVGGSGG